MNAALERRILDALDDALSWPRGERPAHLAEIAAADPGLAARLERLLAVEDAAAHALPTVPPAAAEEGQEPLPPPERIGVYRLTVLLGEGGMGTVWRGERDDGLFAQAVAVKLVRPGLYAASALAQFAAERRMLARLQHPAIAQLFDGGTDPEGRAYFVMELVEGVPLTDHARISGLDLRACVPLLVAICAAVSHAHRGLVVHADIKPGNILVNAEGRPKLLDFGIARGLDAADEELAGHGLTLAYASPQRRAGERPVPADDIYALGAMVWELCVGTPPVDAPPRALAPGDAPAELSAIVAKATAAAAEDRYDGANALADDLRRWAAVLPVRALPSRPSRSLHLLLRRRPLASAAAGAAAIGLVVALVVVSALYLRAETERREADRRFEEARGMAHYMLFDLFGRLTDTPGTLPLRRALADRARSYLDELAAAPRAPVAVKAEAAIGLMQVAGVDGLFTAGELGDRARTAGALAEAARLLADPPAGAANDPRWIYAQGRLKLFEGLRLFDQSAGSGDALPLFRDAVAELGRARDALPGDAEIATDLWQARLFLADAHGTEGDFYAEVETVRAAIADYDRSEALLDTSETTPLLVARSFKLIGQAQAGGGSAAVAETAFRRAEAKLVDEERIRPGRTRTLMEMLDVRWGLAGSLEAQGRIADALAITDGALSAASQRLAAEPDHDGLQRMASLIEAQRARLLGALGRTAEARTAAESSLSARARRHATRPDDGVAWREFLSALQTAGTAAQMAGDGRLACARFGEARAGYDVYLSRFPASRTFVAKENSRLNEWLRSCLGSTGAPPP